MVRPPNTVAVCFAVPVVVYEVTGVGQITVLFYPIALGIEEQNLLFAAAFQRNPAVKKSIQCNSADIGSAPAVFIGYFIPPCPGCMGIIAVYDCPVASVGFVIAQILLRHLDHMCTHSIFLRENVSITIPLPTQEKAHCKTSNAEDIPMDRTPAKYGFQLGIKSAKDLLIFQFHRDTSFWRYYSKACCKLQFAAGFEYRFYKNKYSASVRRALLWFSGQSPAMRSSSKMTIRSALSKSFGSI
jgi:hypothetical protein